MNTEEVVGFPLLMWSNAKDPGFFAKGLIERKDLFVLKYLVKDTAAIEPNPRRLSNMKWLFEALLLIVFCEYHNSLSYVVFHVFYFNNLFLH